MSIRFTGPDGMSEPITCQEMYSDGTPRIKTAGWDRIVRKADTVVVQAESLMEFVNAMFLVDAVTFAGGNITKLVLPYIPGARQDRTNPTGDVLFTARSAGIMVTERCFNEVIVLDPHSQESVRSMGNLFLKVREYPLENVVKEIPTQYDGVIAPDKGARVRSKRVADALGLPLFFGGKTRDVATGKLTGFTLDNLSAEPFYIENGHFLVTDDICDGGGTFLGLFNKITEQGATADLYVSHGIFSKGTVPLTAAFNNVYTTDSFLGRHDGVKVIPVVKDMENF